MRIFAAVSLCMLILFLKSPASHADFEVCNKAKFDIYIAYGFYIDSHWQTAGWRKTKAEQCSTLRYGNVSGKTFYVYAEGSGEYRHVTWGGGPKSAFLCVHPTDKFEIKGYDKCEERGYKKQSFFIVETGDNESYTQSLTYNKEAERKIDTPSESEKAEARTKAIIGVLRFLYNWSEENERQEQLECMENCDESKSRCVELCTQ